MEDVIKILRRPESKKDATRNPIQAMVIGQVYTATLVHGISSGTRLSKSPGNSGLSGVQIIGYARAMVTAEGCLS